MQRLLGILAALLCCSAAKTHAAPIRGEASWYGQAFAGRPTSTGEKYDPKALTAAHKTLPLGTIVRVACEGRAVTVRINDRGPYVGNRIIDLSERAASLLHMREKGVTMVTLSVLRMPLARPQMVGSKRLRTWQTRVIYAQR